MFPVRKPFPSFINFFLFIFFSGLTYTCSGNFPGTSCFPNHYAAFHNCRCFDNSFDVSKVVLQPHTYTSWNLKLWKLVLYFGRVNAIATGLTIVITLLNIVVHKLRQLKEGRLGEKNKPWGLSSGQFCRRFSFSEIELATHDFHEEFLIGKGGFGKVYKGLIDRGETTVAIKRLDSKSKQGASEFWTEINMLSSFRHCHLISLIGYCEEFQEMILVYEYMPNGNLNDHLHKVGRSDGDFPLSWVQRLKICIGAARALDYLHTGTGLQHRVIHRDVKSSNILLDKNWGVKISDFGVAKIGAADKACTHVSTEVKGSFGYFDPHYFLTRKLTRKSDVYAFGVVLFEVLCGRPAVDLTLEEDQQSLSRWAQHCIQEGMSGQIIDPSLKGQIAHGCLMTFVQIADQCLENLPKKRPTMAEVVVKLESALAMQERNDSSSSVRHHDDLKRSGDNSGRLFSMKSDRTMAFSRMLRHFFSVKTRLSSVQGDAKLSRKKKSNNKSILDCVFPSKELVPKKHGGVREDLPLREQIATLNLKVFTLAELKSSTMNFSQDMVLGKGGYGTVFMAWVDKNTYAPSKVGVGMPIAVKRLDTDGFQGHKEWQMEVKISGRLRHSNLIKLRILRGRKGITPRL